MVQHCYLPNIKVHHFHLHAPTQVSPPSPGLPRNHLPVSMPPHSLSFSSRLQAHTTLFLLITRLDLLLFRAVSWRNAHFPVT